MESMPPSADDPFAGAVVRDLLATTHIPVRSVLERQVKDILRSHSPYALWSTDIAERLGQPLVTHVLRYLALFGEVEQRGRGRYALAPGEHDTDETGGAV
jgi:hypothetical protein